jgi:hypothetical protein
MRIELPLSGRRFADTADDRPPRADNDDDPFDPPPARALRAPVLTDVTMVVADAAADEATLRAA